MIFHTGVLEPWRPDSAERPQGRGQRRRRPAPPAPPLPGRAPAGARGKVRGGAAGGARSRSPPGAGPAPPPRGLTRKRAPRSRSSWRRRGRGGHRRAPLALAGRAPPAAPRLRREPPPGAGRCPPIAAWRWPDVTGRAPRYGHAGGGGAGGAYRARFRFRCEGGWPRPVAGPWRWPVRGGGRRPGILPAPRLRGLFHLPSPLVNRARGLGAARKRLRLRRRVARRCATVTGARQLRARGSLGKHFTAAAAR